MFFTILLIFCSFTKIFSDDCSCGVAAGKKRVFGGTEVTVSKYPWMVYLYLTKPGRHSFCGGAIINDRYILTAAHCTDTAIKVQFSYGSNYMGTTDTLHDVEKIIQHEAFHLPSHHNDIALLRLKNPINFSSNVKPLCLPTTDVDQSGELTLAGWGKTDDGFNSDTLMETSFTESDWDACNTRHYNRLVDSQFCAGGVSKDACNGDSGGPLIKKVDGKSVVVGIVSTGIGHCGTNQFSTYTKVTSFLQWIDEKTNDANYCS